MKGPSGSGKSQLIPLIIDSCEKPATLAASIIDPDKPLIEAFGMNARATIRLLGTVGLLDAFAWCRRRHELSDGQQARAEIAGRLASPGDIIVLDDFLNGLDRITAKAVAWTIGRAVKTAGRTLIAVTPHDDLADYLNPDLIVRCNNSHVPDLETPDEFAGTCPLLATVRYRRGTIGDWKALKPLHYAAEDPATVHSYHALDLEAHPGPAAIAVMSYPDLHSAARNIATSDAYKIAGDKRQAMKVNREVLKLSRLVVAPGIRGIGLTHLMIAALIDNLNCRWIECVTAMGRYSNFLERAGFREVPQQSHPIEAKLQEFCENNKAPLDHLIDPEKLVHWSESLSVRRKREFRRLAWRYYHHFVIHRRTRKSPAKVVPAPNDPRWLEVWPLISRRLAERPAYYILGPIDELKDGSDGRQRPLDSQRTFGYDYESSGKTAERQVSNGKDSSQNEAEGQARTDTRSVQRENEKGAGAASG